MVHLVQLPISEVQMTVMPVVSVMVVIRPATQMEHLVQMPISAVRMPVMPADSVEGTILYPP